MRLVLAGLALLAAPLPAPVATAALDPPVDGPVVAGFDAPTRYGPGHRGVDLQVLVSTSVRSPAAGRISFAGRVVDATWVTVDHGTLRSTVGPLSSVSVGRGDLVARGDELGTSGRAHGRPAVHWSVRRGDTYLDPMARGPLLGTLLPDGRAPAHAGPGAGVGWPRDRVR